MGKINKTPLTIMVTTENKEKFFKLKDRCAIEMPALTNDDVLTFLLKRLEGVDDKKS